MNPSEEKISSCRDPEKALLLHLQQAAIMSSAARPPLFDGRSGNWIAAAQREYCVQQRLQFGTRLRRHQQVIAL